MTQTPLTSWRWKRAEYDRLVDLDVFRGKPIELIGGQLVVAEAQSAYHASAVGTVDYALRAAVPSGWTVRVQAPIALDEESEPEPDLAVVSGRPADYRAEHPAHPVLVVEVAESSLAFDRAQKGSLYARAGIEDYWIVNLVDRVLEVYREPVRGPSSAYGWRYRSVIVLTSRDVTMPLALPPNRIAVADLLR
ncbi:MAG TPA: Uma2 family endonuclease [Candidatus Methylomirabilis sp.]|nr:Uma2 family endonuclease [Candidatus Methylomirabilis sp.]